MSSAGGTITGLFCTELSSSQTPMWLDRYIEAIGKHAELFDYAVFSMVLARHIKDKAKELGCQCMTIPTQTIRSFWEALASVVHHSFEEVIVCRTTELLRMLNLLQAESALSLVGDQEDRQAQINWTPSQPETFDVSDTNLIIRSSDHIDFRVHSPYWQQHRQYSKIYYPFPSLLTVKLSTGSPWFNCRKAQSY